jgi:hypothetical protein
MEQSMNNIPPRGKNFVTVPNGGSNGGRRRRHGGHRRHGLYP